MTDWMTTTATVCFSPALNKRGSQQRRDGKTTEWWLILSCARELGRYYRQLYAEHYWHTRQLQEPLWGTHVSVIRDECPDDKSLWLAGQGETVELVYSADFQVYSGFVVAPVRCDAMLDYRQALGLPREPEYGLHLTIGNAR